MRIIYTSKNEMYRVVEKPDSDFDYDNLAGDCFNPKVNPEIPIEQLKEEEQHFKDLIEREGVFGYVLERWNPEPNCGWEHVDSCWGFVGQYTPTEDTFNHYIVDELKSQIPEVGAA